MADDDMIPGSKDGIREIGRISTLRSDIDPPEHSDGSLNISKQLKSRMSVIDLIPCQFNISLSTILKSDNSDFSDKFIPDITYKKAIEDYNWMLWSYGLDSCDFLRLYLTDTTSSTDEMSNTYDKNVLDSTLDSLVSNKWTSGLATAFKFAQSTGAATPGKSGETGVGWVDKVIDTVKANISPGVSDGLNLGLDVLTHGTKIAFPKIWSGSDFSPNLSCNIKLISPYGHPDAINEFIIKPLCYLLILLSPTTTQGITINRPNYLTLKSYGLANFSLCYPKSMSIRRGGDDSSYNQYCQPMTVDINLTFETVTAGFACFKNFGGMDGQTGKKHPEADLFGENSDLGTEDYEKDFTQPNSLFPTLRSVINSFRPKGNAPPPPPGPLTPHSTGGGGAAPDPAADLDLSPTLSTSGLGLFAPPTGGRIIVS